MSKLTIPCHNEETLNRLAASTLMITAGTGRSAGGQSIGLWVGEVGWRRRARIPQGWLC